MKKLNTQITAIICAVILGSSFLLVQLNKQASIEKQKLQEIALEKLIMEEEEQAKADKDLEDYVREIDLDLCIKEAGNKYWEYMELNGEKDDDEIITAETRFWSDAKTDKQRSIDNCYKRYGF